MKTYRAKTTIHASPEKIWGILTDAQGYPAWDESLERIDGELKLGERVTFLTKLSAQAFPVKVTVFEPGKKLVLTGGMPLGLFKSERTHKIAVIEEGKTAFHTQENFSGLLLPLFGKNIPDLTENFERFVAALKKQAEN